MVRQLELPVDIVRTAPPPRLLPFTEFFQGFDKVAAVRASLGEDADKILSGLKVEFLSSRYAYMAVSHRDAHVIVSTWHIGNSDTRTLYLDLIHELFHVGQFHREREFFVKGWERLLRDPLSYFRNPIEVPAYRHTVDEAKRIGMSYREIVAYLEVPWATPMLQAKFLKTLGVTPGKTSRRKVSRFPVTIARKAPISLYPFTAYFTGFENVPGVRDIFGHEAERVLNRLQVEFYSLPLGYAGMNEKDGHLMVSTPHLRDSDLSILYLDLFLCLQFVAQFLDGRFEAGQAFNPAFGAKIHSMPPKVRDELSRKVGFAGYQDFLARMKANKDFAFFDFPPMIDAYQRTVAEAQRIGMTYAEIIDYLNAPEIAAMTPARLRRFARNLGLVKKAS